MVYFLGVPFFNQMPLPALKRRLKRHPLLPVVVLLAVVKALIAPESPVSALRDHAGLFLSSSGLQESCRSPDSYHGTREPASSTLALCLTPEKSSLLP